MPESLFRRSANTIVQLIGLHASCSDCALKRKERDMSSTQLRTTPQTGKHDTAGWPDWHTAKQTGRELW
jgi:hypothetical protein